MEHSNSPKGNSQLTSRTVILQKNERGCIEMPVFRSPALGISSRQNRRDPKRKKGKEETPCSETSQIYPCKKSQYQSTLGFFFFFFFPSSFKSRCSNGMEGGRCQTAQVR